MAKDLPPGTSLSDEPIKETIVKGIVTDRPAGRQPTANETADLIAEVGHIANERAAAQKPAKQAAKRQEIVQMLASNAAAVDFKPEHFNGNDLQMFAKLSAAKATEAGVDSQAAQALVIEDLKAAHAEKLSQAARDFTAPIKSDRGYLPDQENIIQTNQATRSGEPVEPVKGAEKRRPVAAQPEDKRWGHVEYRSERAPGGWADKAKATQAQDKPGRGK